MWTDIVFSCECEAACGGERVQREGGDCRSPEMIFSLNIAKIMSMIIKCSVSGVVFF